jgi:hypothetical protein
MSHVTFCAVTFSIMHNTDKSEYAFNIYYLYVGILSIVCIWITNIPTECVRSVVCR